jgi:hypothetical protein
MVIKIGFGLCHVPVDTERKLGLPCILNYKCGTLTCVLYGQD